ncbi:Gfo/Idh/MocA family oxidoreductase [Ilyomonas limi]|uniref:Gfo/Idh/MocA family oxidoreductase n=1 Tax=Ilyomonas limi TaxID=2575867 RepID=A0A4U3KTH7_9BACT|nr:Gfo/Idh/MocA family oxidoreductase [Ilyomonas limi]TKK65815.1 Gfo/Idh/MocA family oxidoreductase [Ilyomonas limi]
MRDELNIQQSITLSKIRFPIYIIGAGGIVKDAHLPAYKKAGFFVSGIFDLDYDKACILAKQFDIPHVYTSINQMVQHAGVKCIYDVAVPANKIMEVLHQLPHGANVLIQKPMGENLQEAKEIVAFTENNNMLAAVNFQLRYAPYINAAHSMIVQNRFGEISDIEININVFTPWHLWSFLYTAPRVEILYHSIHYIDLVRHFLGNPSGMIAKTFKHPAMPQLSSVRSDIIMDYGSQTRAFIHTNHTHDYGLHNQHAYIKIEGAKGAIKINVGALMNYPEGIKDSFEYVLKSSDGQGKWQQLKLEGSWFPDAFIGSMNELMLAATGEKQLPDNGVQDALYTMACVEAAYQSDKISSIALDI